MGRGRGRRGPQFPPAPGTTEPLRTLPISQLDAKGVLLRLEYVSRKSVKDAFLLQKRGFKVMNTFEAVDVAQSLRTLVRIPRSMRLQSFVDGMQRRGMDVVASMNGRDVSMALDSHRQLEEGLHPEFAIALQERGEEVVQSMIPQVRT